MSVWTPFNRSRAVGTEETGCDANMRGALGLARDFGVRRTLGSGHQNPDNDCAQVRLTRATGQA